MLCPEALLLLQEQLVPQSDEVGVIQGYKGDAEDLGGVERLFRGMLRIGSPGPRTRALVFRQELHGRLVSLVEDAVAVQSAVTAIKTSTRLRDFLHAALLVGNAMNDTSAEEVAGFALSSLPMLAETKAYDGKTTALDFVVQTLCRNGKRDGASFLSDIDAACSVAMRAPLPKMQEDLTAVTNSKRQFDGAVKLLLKDAADDAVSGGPVAGVGGTGGSTPAGAAPSEAAGVGAAAKEATAFQRSAASAIDAVKARVHTAQSSYAKMLDYFGEP